MLRVSGRPEGAPADVRGTNCSPGLWLPEGTMDGTNIGEVGL
jgi:hypothetical protein